VDFDSVLSDLIDQSPRLKSTDAQIVLRDRYETYFGVYNHSAQPAHPFGLISMNWTEDNVTGGPLSERMHQFVDYRIGEYFKVSFDEFIDRPTWQCDLMIKTASEFMRREKPIIDKALDQMKANQT